MCRGQRVLREAVNELSDNKRLKRDEWQASGLQLSRDDRIVGTEQRINYSASNINARHLFLISRTSVILRYNWKRIIKLINVICCVDT